jgi:hypothetical protein
VFCPELVMYHGGSVEGSIFRAGRVRAWSES